MKEDGRTKHFPMANKSIDLNIDTHVRLCAQVCFVDRLFFCPVGAGRRDIFLFENDNFSRNSL